ncbi:hypothetical protein XELAEV_18011715mg [Xenopus laevis]|uniref:SMB domain-containing protein n=1 Tax=Xenopus laevis TaxID=8355 RepID=A0A974HXH4_XENLA|nr:hypothetical protein XELAEV_18011715mg [Xenopus laevis]
MKVLLFPALLLLLGAVRAAHAAEESCAGRCFSGFDGNKKCQCDIICVHFESCCIDYLTLCKPKGKYFYELDDKSALDGYPKLIKDVWGIDGPVDAAFTRMNCQGKTYLFKGKEYWRFSNGVLESDYPRNISEGFHDIPDNIDAAFALPANNHNDREKVYFFKGNKYWQYEFQNQPSRKDCQDSAQSELFTYYVTLQKDSWEDFFSFLFGPSMKRSTAGPWYINKDWKGVPNNVDAVLPSRIYVPKQTRRSRRRKSRRRNNRKKSGGMRSLWSDFSFDPLDGLFDYDDEQSDPDWLPPERPADCQPTQNVYFFKNDKYYRVNLRTKRVDYVYPPYPRSIAQYWLGCKKDERLEKSRG